MKVILLETIASVGKLGDVINVRPGFARNYLFPQGRAERASKAATEEFERRRGELEKRQQDRLAAIEKVRDALDGYTLQVTARASPDRNLYGSITAQMITTALNGQDIMGGVLIKRTQVELADGPLKELGDHSVGIKLTGELRAVITVSVMTEAEVKPAADK